MKKKLALITILFLAINQISKSQISDTIVVPAAQTNAVDIIIEKSSDSQNWTACSPGQYGKNNKAKFYRIRKAEK